MNKDRFEDVNFPQEYPRSDVAEHEVLMAFRNDSGALAFREWWEAKGAVLFGKWFKRQERLRREGM